MTDPTTQSSSQAVTVRKATVADLPELMRLAKDFHFAMRLKRYAAWEQSEDAWRDWLLACIAGGPRTCLVAVGSNGVIGLVTAIAAGAFWNPAVIYAREASIWVDPRARGSGAATALLAELAEWARQSGACLLAAGRPYSMGHGSSPKTMDRLLGKLGYEPAEKIYSRRVA